MRRTLREQTEVPESAKAQHLVEAPGAWTRLSAGMSATSKNASHDYDPGLKTVRSDKPAGVIGDR